MIKVRSSAISHYQTAQGKEESQGDGAGGTACTFLTQGAQSDKENERKVKRGKPPVRLSLE